jgi:hypothetical protein
MDQIDCLICELTTYLTNAYHAAVRGERHGVVDPERVDEYEDDLWLITEYPHRQEA